MPRQMVCKKKILLSCLIHPQQCLKGSKTWRQGKAQQSQMKSYMTGITFSVLRYSLQFPLPHTAFCSSSLAQLDDTCCQVKTHLSEQASIPHVAKHLYRHLYRHLPGCNMSCLCYIWLTAFVPLVYSLGWPPAIKVKAAYISPTPACFEAVLACGQCKLDCDICNRSRAMQAAPQNLAQALQLLRKLPQADSLPCGQHHGRSSTGAVLFCAPTLQYIHFESVHHITVCTYVCTCVCSF